MAAMETHIAGVSGEGGFEVSSLCQRLDFDWIWSKSLVETSLCRLRKQINKKTPCTQQEELCETKFSS